MYNSLNRGKLNEGFQKKLRKLVSKHTDQKTKLRSSKGAIDRLNKVQGKNILPTKSLIGHAKNNSNFGAALVARNEKTGHKGFKHHKASAREVHTRTAKSVGLINKDSVQYERGVVEGLGTKIIGGVAKRMITWPAAAIGGLVSGAKEVGANIKASKEKTVAKPTKGTIKPKKGKLAKPVPTEPEV